MVFIYFLISLILDIRPPARRGCAPPTASASPRPALCAGGEYLSCVSQRHLSYTGVVPCHTQDTGPGVGGWVVHVTKVKQFLVFSV